VKYLLLQLEFQRVMIDEAQQLGTTSTRLSELCTSITAKHKMVMSGKTVLRETAACGQSNSNLASSQAECARMPGAATVDAVCAHTHCIHLHQPPPLVLSVNTCGCHTAVWAC
jgi:hypothetical protein